MKWYSFINSLDSFFENYVYKYNGVTLTCKLDKSSLKPKNDGIHLLVDFFVDVDNPSKSEYETVHREYKGFPIAELPLYDEQNDGFKGPYKIHKTVYKLIPSSGYTMFDGTLQYTNPYKVVFFSDTTYVYRSDVKNTKSSESKISASDVNKIPLITFIRAITGKSYKEINTFFDGMINFSIPAEYLSADVETCAQKVLRMFYSNSNKPRNISSTNSFKDLHNYLCVNSTGLAGKEKIRKFQDIQSFHRLEGTVIHKIPSYANVEVGTTITRQVANALDALDETNPVLECQVKIPSTGKIVTFKRCKCSLNDDSVVKEQFNPEEFMYAVYNYLLTTVGIPYSDDRNSLDCCVLQDATEIIKSNLHRILYNISKNLTKHLDNSPNKDNILDESIFNKVFDSTGENKTPLNHMLDYIKSSDESRDSDVTNSLATFQQSYKISKVKLPCYQQIHESHVGRIDPYATPESKDAGLNSVMCLRASIDQYKYITRPVYKVNNGVVDTSKEIQLSTLDELYKIIAPYGVNLTDYIEGNKIVQKCTLNFKEIDVPVSEVEYQLAYQNSAGPALSGCFYAAHNNSKRLDMANNAINQAAPVIIPERSYIRSELDDLDVGIYRAKDIIKSCCSAKGIPFDNSVPYTLSQVKVVTDDKTLTVIGKLNPPIKLSDGSYFADIKSKFTRTFKSANSTYNRLNLKPSKTGVYANEDIVLYMNDIDLYGDNEHSFAVGNNIKVLFICNEGFGYEDSAQISKRYRDNFGLCTPNSTRITEEDEDNIFIYTNKYRGNKATEDYLNDDGLPKVGTRLYPGNVVIGRSRPDTTTMKDIPSPVTLKNKEEGIVLYSKKTVRNGHTYIEIMLWNLLTVDAGDKLTGFHGNKSVCSRAINIEDIFYTADGQVPDLILNPLGVPGRENVGQLIESIQAEISKQANKHIKYDPSQPIDVHDLVVEAEGYDIKPVTVYDPKTGEPLREKCFMGTMYFTRSTHIMSSKYNACTLKTSISATTHQTKHETGGGGGQRISEMTAWSYKALGCNIVYDTLTSLHSDDLEHLSALKQAINLNKPYAGEYSNCNADRLTAYFRFLGINFYSQSGVTKFEPIGTKKAETLVPQPFTSTDLAEHDNIICSKYSNLSSKNRSEEYSRRQKSLRTDYAKIDVKFDFIHPLFMSQASFCNLFLYTKAYKMEKGKVVIDDKIAPLSPNKMSSLLSKSSAKVKETCYIGVIGSNCNDDSRVIRNDVDITGLFVILNSKIANMSCSDDPYNRKYFEIVQEEYRTVLYNDIRDVFHCIYNPESVQDGEDPLNGKTFYNLTTAEKYFKDSANSIKNITIDEDEESPEDASIVKFDILTSEENDTTEVVDDLSAEMIDGADSETVSDNEVPSGIDDKNKKMVNYYAVFRMFKNTYAQPGMTGFGEFMTKYMIIPPPLVRPMKDLKAISTTGAQSTYLTTIGKEMSTIVKSIKGNDVPAVIYEHIANSIGKTFSNDISAKDLDQYSVFVELFRHNNKKSVVRDQMVAKRIDFSGRSVISVNPRLRMGQAGVPLRLALTIHERRIIHDLMEMKNSIIKNVVDSNYGNSKDLQRTEKINIYSDICQKLSTGAFNRIKINNLVGDYTTKPALIHAMKQELINITNRVLRQYPAVLSRDPALHQFSIAGFNTIVTDGFAIEIHPLSCKGFNADFDGDQMSINYPQHAEAIRELQRVGMFGINLINPQSGESIIEYAQDSVAGFYYATCDEPNPNNIKDVVFIKHNNRYSGDLMFRHYDLLNLYDKLESRMISVNDTIVLYYKGRKYLTTVGRAMFNSLTGFEETLTTDNKYTKVTDDNGEAIYYLVKYNSPIKKGTIRDIVTKYIIEHKAECDKERLENNYSPYEGKHGEMLAIFDRYKDFGYYMSKESGITLSIWDLDAVTEPTVDKSIDDANEASILVGTYKSLGFLTDASTKKIRKGIWSSCDSDLTNQFKSSLKNSKSLQLMIDSGARGTVSNLVHMCGMVGTVLNTKQEEMEQPIRSSYARGLCISEQLANSYNGRRVLLNTQLGTPITGEQTRQLIYMAEHLHIVNYPDTYLHSCDSRPMTLELEYSLDIQALKDELSTQSLVAFNPAKYNEYLQYCNDSNLTSAIDASEASKWDKCVDLMESYESSDYQDKYTVKSYIANNVNQAILKSAGKYYVVNFKYKLDELYRNILKMRSLEMKTVADYSLVKQLKSVCSIEVEYDEQGMIDKEWYIITDKGIDLIEKYHVHKLGIYTIIGCKHRDGICPRCFGYDYKNLQKPVVGLNIGHVAAQAIGECTTQLTLDTHKADSSGNGDNNAKLSDGNMDVAWREPKNLNINAASYLTKLVNDYQDALSEDLCMGTISNEDASGYPRFNEEHPSVSFARTSGRVSVNKYRNFYLITLGDDQCIADSSCINVCDGEYVYKGKSFISYPLIDKMFANAPVKYKDGVELGVPDVIEESNSVTNPYYEEYANPAWLEAAKDVWLTIVKEVISKFGVLGRNIETIVRTMVEIGLALETKEELNIFRGYYYPVSLLRDAEITYLVHPVSYSKNMLYHNKIIANMAKDDPKSSIAQAIVYGLEDSGSTITDILTSALHVVDADGNVNIVRQSVGVPVNNTDSMDSLINKILSNMETNTEQLTPEEISEESENSVSNSDTSYYDLDDADDTNLF